MGTISSDVGLVTGINITDTVNKLIALQAAPRDRLQTKIATLKDQQTALTELTALVLSVQNAGKRLKDISVVGARSVSTGDSKALTVTAASTTAPGAYALSPIQKAQAAQVVSGGFTSRTTAIGAGTLTFRNGPTLNESLTLDQLNGGSGVAAGKIRITDRSGDSSVVDLRNARTIDDVINAINSADGSSISAEVSGDRIKLIDQSGGTGNLRVQEVGGGRTAADLGLSSINVSAASATGQDVLKLYDGLSLSRLNGGNGISLRDALPDLVVNFRDGSNPLAVDFNRLGHAAQTSTGTTAATNGLNSELRFTSVSTGAASDGVRVKFIDSGSVTARGSETVAYDSGSKTLTFDIKGGATTADDIVSALGNNPAINAQFTVARAPGSNGTGLVTTNDAALLFGGAEVTARKERTLGELVTTINEADPTRLRASISSDGDRLVLTDLTSGGGSFSVQSSAGGTAAEDLGLTGTAVGGTLTGGRLLPGLKGTLLRTLNGGAGLGTLGQVQLTDRSGATATVNLSSAQTVEDATSLINASGLGLKASINAAGTGLSLVDTTGLSTSNLIVANGDGTNTATKLGLVANVAANQVAGTALNRQVVSEGTLLSTYNGGGGVPKGSFILTNSQGQQGAINLTTLNPTTVGEVITAINGLGIGVTAKINDAGDGIALVDRAGGAGTLNVREVGSGTSADSLKIKGDAVGGTIQGSTTTTVTVSATDTLDDVVTKINALKSSVTASVYVDAGSDTPFHLSLQSNQSGQVGQLVAEGSTSSLAFSTLAKGQDAILRYSSNVGSRFITSSSNTFTDVVAGLSVTMNSTAAEPVNVEVAASIDAGSKALQTFVDMYNKLRDKIDKVTSFSTTGGANGVLFGSSDVVRVESLLGSVLSGRLNGVGNVRSLAELGVSFTDSGDLTFDSTKLQDRFAKDPQAITRFFTDDKAGFGKRVDDAIESLAGIKNGSLVNRAAAMQRNVDDLTNRVTALSARLDKNKETMLTTFYNLEQTISKIRSNGNALAAMTSTTSTTK